MKKLLQKIVSMAVMVTVLCPSISSADGLSDGLKYGGGGVGVVSGVLWYIQNDEVNDCEIINDNNGYNASGDIRINSNRGSAGTKCINHADLKNTATAYGVVTLLGFGAMGLGFILDNKNAFQTRHIPNGIAIERDGVSFSATNAGQMKLQKRWEF